MNENNDLNNVEPTVENPVAPEVTETPAPAAAPELTQPEVPATPEAAVTPEVPATPEVATTPEVAAPAPEVTQAVVAENPAPAPVEAAPAVEPAQPAAPVTPEAQPTAPVGGDPMAVTTEPPKKKVPVLVIIAILMAIFAAVYFLFLKKDEEPAPEPTPVENNTVAEPTKEEKFVELAGKYVKAVEDLWTTDKMVCQNPSNTNETLKPSELSSTDSWGGPAYYYVFIDTAASDEMKLDVDDKTAVAGWVRIGKTDNSYYVALSDGTNYIVDKGTDEGMGIKSSALTAKDVVTTGNGNNYQYKNGEIFGSQTDGKGWGIGDSVVLADDDKSNDGIYMSNGKKTGGYTPFCSNIE